MPGEDASDSLVANLIDALGNSDRIGNALNFAHEVQEPRVLLSSSSRGLECSVRKSKKAFWLEHVGLHLPLPEMHQNIFGKPTREAIRNAAPAEDQKREFRDHILPNVKDQPHVCLARAVRKHGT